MKKYLLTALLGVFGFVGAFASAVELSIISDGPEYNPSSYTLENDITFTTNSFSNVSCMDYGMISISSSNSNLSCDFEYNNGGFSLFQNNNNCTFTAGTTINFSKGAGETCESLTLNLGGSSSGGGSSSDSDSGTLLPGGESDLSGIITGLNSTINEFIPYLVYLGLGIITVVIGFVAIRWLVNRTQAKVRGTFSSGRRRR